MTNKFEKFLDTETSSTTRSETKSRKVESSTFLSKQAATKSIKVTVETHKQLMILKAVTGISITELVAESVQQYGASHLNHNQRNLSQSLLEDPNQLSLDID